MLTPQHRHVIPVTREAWSVLMTGDSSRKRIKGRQEQLTVIAATRRKIHQQWSRIGRVEIEKAVELGVSRLPNVHFLEQPQQSVVLRRPCSRPTIKVKALRDLLSFTL